MRKPSRCAIKVPRELILSESSLKTALYLTRAFSYSPFRNNFSPSAITAAGKILIHTWYMIPVKFLVRSDTIELDDPAWATLDENQVKLPPILPCSGNPYFRLLFVN